MSDTLSDRRLGATGGEASLRTAATPAVRSMRAIGTTATVAVTTPERAERASAMLAEDLAELDLACSRFREDSELRRLERDGGGRPVRVSPLLSEALGVACDVAVRTMGIVDPTIGSAIVELGYDRDFDEIEAVGREPARPEPAPGWWRIELHPGRRTATVPAGVHVDLGATAKAFAADRSAARMAAALGCGVLVNLGGDVAVSGPPPEGGWAIGIASDCTARPEAADQVVAISSGGLASSGTTARSWTHNGRTVHHIIDPWTGQPAPRVWSLVSTTAASCVEANAWSTASVVWGDDAVGTLEGLGVCARLVRADGSVVRVGGWPEDLTGPGGAEHREPSRGDVP
jgi:thiamine biosynthesis lipoprotein